jgi:hypothetical protein
VQQLPVLIRLAEEKLAALLDRPAAGCHRANESGEGGQTPSRQG